MINIADRAAKIRELIATARDADEELFAFRLLSAIETEEQKVQLSQFQRARTEAVFRGFAHGARAITGLAIAIGVCLGALVVVRHLVVKDEIINEQQSICEEQIKKNQVASTALTETLREKNEALNACSAQRESFKASVDLIVKECTKGE